MSNLSKATGILGAMAVVGAGTFAAANYPVTTATLDDAIRASVQVGKYCSGTVIQDPDLSDGEQMTVITAKHCLGEGESVGSVIEVNVPRVTGNYYDGDTTTKVIVKSVSDKSDVILLQAVKKDEGLDIPKIDIYGGMPKFGTKVFGLGYPAGEFLTLTDGYLGYTVNMMYVLKGMGCVFDSVSCDYQKASDPIYPGSSGGGLFIETDTGYELLGVLTGYDRRMSFSTYYTPIEEIREFISENGPREACLPNDEACVRQSLQ